MQTPFTSSDVGISPEQRGRIDHIKQELAQAVTLQQVSEIARKAAREVNGADGATIVLREGELCHYMDEDAVAPLWKGKRFPMQTCISGWAMLHNESAAIEYVFTDPRIPHAAYRTTFVKSLIMTPIGRNHSTGPIGAIGNYWAEIHKPTAQEIALLEEVAEAVTEPLTRMLQKSSVA